MVTQPSLLVNVLIVVGESSWIFGAEAQLRKLKRTHNARGLSALTQTLNTAGNIGWCTYFALNHLWFPFFTNIIFFILGVAILGYILLDREKFIKGLLAILIIGPITSYVLLRAPSDSGWLGVMYNWIAATPWLIKIIYTKKVSGISEKSLYYGICAMSCTLAYGLIIHSQPLVVGCLRGFIYTAVIMLYYYRYRRRR